MSHQVAFDWLIGEDEFLSEIAGYSEDVPGERISDGERKLALFALRALVALVFVIIATGSMPYSPAQLDRMKIESEIGTVLELDQAAWRARDVDRHNALIDPQVGRGWLGVWRDNWGSRSVTGYAYSLTLGPTLRLSEDLVQAEVYVTLPRTNWWQPSITRETRFYRMQNGTWLRTLPPDSYWGELQTLQTSNLTFQYYATDAQSVHAVAEKLDSAYTELYRILGLDAIPDDGPTVVVLKPGLERYSGWDRGVIEIMSPKLAQIPRGSSNAEYLADRVFRRVASRALRPRGANYRWAFEFTVIRGWLEGEILEQHSQWRQESVDVFRTYTAHQFPLTLGDIDEYYVGGVPGRDTVLWRYAAADSIIDYAVEREGRDVLPEFVAAFSSYGTWAGLIDAVFNTSIEEFSAGWNDYLAAEYGFGDEAGE